MAHPVPTDVVSVPLDQKQVAKHIDHTLLKPDATPAQITVLCEEAKKHSFKSCCVNSYYIPLVTSLLSGSSSIPCAVVGFPLGACTTSTKAFETTEAIKSGAKEIDMVINIGLLKSGDLVGLCNDISSVVSAAAEIPVKVIIETSLLTKEQKISASVTAALAGAAYVKTSTGFNGGGATVEDVELMYQAVVFKKGAVKVKASGGVRSFEYGQSHSFAFFGLTTPSGLPSPCCALEPTGSGHRPVFQSPLAQEQRPVHTKVADVHTLLYCTTMCYHLELSFVYAKNSK
ncbi:deoxyribose-phosphate aldolase [Thelephora ganbajun]|uniref:Deoxyribose-phosphate aldolase n=1 Tax=Thelephora ganbajun TaxID=370292 RepID=A0ACB6ZP27_THEGA|nr:deoxyribose-phosphate aldolase [Thelephora ganbajun]